MRASVGIVVTTRAVMFTNIIDRRSAYRKTRKKIQMSEKNTHWPTSVHWKTQRLSPLFMNTIPSFSVGAVLHKFKLNHHAIPEVYFVKFMPKWQWINCIYFQNGKKNKWQNSTSDLLCDSGSEHIEFGKCLKVCNELTYTVMHLKKILFAFSNSFWKKF